jgi:hypothetical protein
MSDIKVRALTVADRDWVSGLIKKLVAKLGNDEFLKLLVSDSEKADSGDGEAAAAPNAKEKKYAVLVIRMIEMMIEVIGADVREWFASLIGKTPDEFRAMPFDTELVILEQLMEIEESNRFFSRALALSSRIKGFVDGLKGRKQP